MSTPDAREAPLADAMYECCIAPPMTEHADHVLAALQRNGWTLAPAGSEERGEGLRADLDTLDAAGFTVHAGHAPAESWMLCEDERCLRIRAAIGRLDAALATTPAPDSELLPSTVSSQVSSSAPDSGAEERLRAALRRALRQWQMYADEHRTATGRSEFDYIDASTDPEDLEAALFREARATLRACRHRDTTDHFDNSSRFRCRDCGESFEDTGSGYRLALSGGSVDEERDAMKETG